MERSSVRSITRRRKRKWLGWSLRLRLLLCSMVLLGAWLPVRLFGMVDTTSNSWLLENSPPSLLEQPVDPQIPFTNESFDPQYVRNHPLPFTWIPSGSNQSVCSVQPGVGEEGPAGVRGLYKLAQAIQHTQNKTSSSTMRIFCMVYTHSNRHDMIQVLAETYAPHCHGFMAASNFTNATIGAFRLLHEGPESYKNMFNKIRAMWKYAHDHYLDDYDYFHMGGDDMYLLPHNFPHLLPPITSQPLYLGAAMNAGAINRLFCSGGAGYTLNRAALQKLIPLFATQACPPDHCSNEDWRIAKCFQHIGIYCQDTKDDHHETAYHSLDVHFHASWIRRRMATWNADLLETYYNITTLEQLGQISNYSVSFHLDKGRIFTSSRDRGMRRYHALLYGLCSRKFQRHFQKAATCNDHQKAQLRKQWQARREPYKHAFQQAMREQEAMRLAAAANTTTTTATIQQ